MKVLITGRNGQLGYELKQTLPQGIEAVFFDSSSLDITNEVQVQQVLNKEQPQVVINGAAYTAVDKAESEQGAAYAVNQQGCEYLARACNEANAKLIHVSTDFVFDGNSCKPYHPEDKTNPISVYGKSKLAGEKAIQSILPNDSVIIRTAWVYSTHGNNFVKTMLRLMQEREQLGVVCDQVGTPTYAQGLANVIWQFIQQPEKINGKLFHWSDAGVISWYDFAVAIQSIAKSIGLLDRVISIKAIPASMYPTPAARPSFSVLDKSDIESSLAIEAKHWHAQLTEMLNVLKQS